MKNPLTKREDTQVVVSTGDPFVDMVERVSTNKDIDADKLQKILDMQIQVLDRQARQDFYGALNTVQANLPEVINDAVNDQTHSNYARLETISRALKPVYTAEGFSASFTQAESGIADHIRVKGTLTHRGGHSEEYQVDMPLDKTGIKGTVNKTDVHATGSTLKYGRRYLTCLMFDVSTGDSDRDGNADNTEPLGEQLQGTIAAMLKQLSVEDQQSFWKKALAEEGQYEVLLARRWPAYVRFLESKGAVSSTNANP